MPKQAAHDVALPRRSFLKRGGAGALSTVILWNSLKVETQAAVPPWASLLIKDPTAYVGAYRKFLDASAQSVLAFGQIGAEVIGETSNRIFGVNFNSVKKVASDLTSSSVINQSRFFSSEVTPDRTPDRNPLLEIIQTKIPNLFFGLLAYPLATAMRPKPSQPELGLGVDFNLAELRHILAVASKNKLADIPWIAAGPRRAILDDTAKFGWLEALKRDGMDAAALGNIESHFELAYVRQMANPALLVEGNRSWGVGLRHKVMPAYRDVFWVLGNTTVTSGELAMLDLAFEQVV